MNIYKYLLFSALLLSGVSLQAQPLVCILPSCEELTVTTEDGMHIVVQDWGHNRQNKPVLVFLHGTPFDHNLWVNQVYSGLNNSYRIITMDYRGHGNADPVTDPSQVLQKNWGNDIKAVLNNPHYAISKAILIGHSLGGLPVGDYLLQNGSAKVAGVIMVASPFDSHTLLAGASSAELNLFLATLAPMTYSQFWAANEALVQLKFVDPIPWLEVFYLTYRATLLTQTSRANILNGVLSEAAIDKTPAIAALSLPTLFLFGDRNQTQVLQIYLNTYFPSGVPAIPGSTYKVYQGMDHVPMIQDASDFNNDVAKFAFGIFGK